MGSPIDIVDIEQQRRVASLNVALEFLKGAPAELEKVMPLTSWIYAWCSPTAGLEAAGRAKQPSVADNIPGARPVPKHPNFAVIDGDKPMTPPIRKPSEVQAGESAADSPSDTN